MFRVLNRARRPKGPERLVGMHHIVDDEDECEHVAGCSSCQIGDTRPFPCSERERSEIERRAAFYGRTCSEEVAYTLAIMYELREPDPDDEDMIRRLRLMRAHGQLPSQLLEKVQERLASIDRLPTDIIIPRPTTVREVMGIYLQRKLQGRRSYASAKRTVAHTIENSVLADWKLSNLTPEIIVQWHSGMASRHVTGNKGLRLLRSAIRFCQCLGLVEVDPTSRVKHFQEEARERYVTPSEMPRLLYALEHAPLKPQTFLLTVLFTASRPGEVSVMRWRDLDFVGLRWRKPTSKTGRSQEVVLNPVVYRLLRQMPKVSEWVFPGQDRSRPWASCSYQKEWRSIRHVAKLPDVIVYDLRRTMASWATIHGINLSTVQKMLNHSTLQATHRYARLDVETAGRALEGITKHMTAASPFFAQLCEPLAAEELPVEAALSSESSPVIGQRSSAPPETAQAEGQEERALKGPLEMEWPG